MILVQLRYALVPVNWVPVELVPIDSLNRDCSFCPALSPTGCHSIRLDPNENEQSLFGESIGTSSTVGDLVATETVP
jgi:hypothetical protein